MLIILAIIEWSHIGVNAIVAQEHSQKSVAIATYRPLANVLWAHFAMPQSWPWGCCQLVTGTCSVNWSLGLGVCCYCEQFKHGVTGEALTIERQAKNRGPQTISSSFMVCYWSLRQCSLESWKKTALSIGGGEAAKWQGTCCSWGKQCPWAPRHV